MHCKNCGKNNVDEAKFCGYCGSALDIFVEETLTNENDKQYSDDKAKNKEVSENFWDLNEGMLKFSAVLSFIAVIGLNIDEPMGILWSVLSWAILMVLCIVFVCEKPSKASKSMDTVIVGKSEVNNSKITTGNADLDARLNEYRSYKELSKNMEDLCEAELLKKIHFLFRRASLLNSYDELKGLYMWIEIAAERHKVGTQLAAQVLSRMRENNFYIQGGEVSTEEIPVLFYDYNNEFIKKGVYDYGFMLTTRGIRANYRSTDKFETWGLIPYQTITSVEFGYAILAPVMNVYHRNGKKNQIILTGLDEPEKFVKVMHTFLFGNE